MKPSYHLDLAGSDGDASLLRFPDIKNQPVSTDRQQAEQRIGDPVEWDGDLRYARDVGSQSVQPQWQQRARTHTHKSDHQTMSMLAWFLSVHMNNIKCNTC